MGHQASDEELIAQYLQGSEFCLEILLKRYQTKVLSYVKYQINNRDQAEDLFQEIFVKVVRNLRLGKYNEQGKFAHWLMRLAKNYVIDYKRSLNTKSRKRYICRKSDFDIFSVLSDGKKSEEDNMIHQQMIIEVRELIDLLPEDQKEVLYLRHYAKLTFKEIADEKNISINTALGKMRYAIQKLKKMAHERNMSIVM